MAFGNSQGGRLTSVEDWDKSWSGAAIDSIRFDPEIPIYREIHRKLQGFVKSHRGGSFLEIGAYPGYMMWYFQHYFDCRTSGIEYVPWCCEAARRLLARDGVKGQIIQADVFSYAPPQNQPLWDIVTSHGFIEHFDDVTPAISKHIELTRVGGLVVLIVPNHSGIYGAVMRRLNPDKHRLHNCMDLSKAAAAVDSIGRTRTLFAGYVGRFGFWSSTLYETVLMRGRFVYTIVRAPLWALEGMAQYLLPNSRAWSPTFMLVLERTR
jgi:SAM-dependent methyltransferase